MRKIKCEGYTIYSNGTIIGLKGKKIKYNKRIQIKLNGEYRTVGYARFVYYAFHQKDFNVFDDNIIVEHINADISDCNIKNLIALSKNERKNIYLTKLTKQQIKEIKELYKTKETPLAPNSPNTNMSYRKLAKKIGVSHTTIMSVVRGLQKEKLISKR